MTTMHLYWSVTALMAGFMLMASVPDILQVPQAVAIFAHLGYPAHLLPFIGIAKVLGVMAVLVPGPVRLKEWAYAGLVFDLIGALYSHLAVNDPPSAWAMPLVGLSLVIGSYVYYRKRLADAHTPPSRARGPGVHREALIDGAGSHPSTS
jgi:DoxX-like family